jgi:hypothetical protein
VEGEVGGVDGVGCIVVCQLGGGEVEAQAIGTGGEVDQSLEMGL